MRQIQTIALLLCLVAFAACGRGTKSTPQAAGDTVRMKYAKLLHIVEHDGYTVVSIDNPWRKGKLLHKYVLVPRTGCDARVVGAFAGAAVVSIHAPARGATIP